MLSFKDQHGNIVYIKHKLILEISEVNYSDAPQRLQEAYKGRTSRIIVAYDSLTSIGYQDTASSGVTNRTNLFSSEPATEIYKRWKKFKKDKT